MPNVSERILNLVKKRVNRVIEFDTDLYKNGFDSLMMMELVVDIESEFGVELPPEALARDRLRSIAKITQSVEALL
jgi:acyl carrier protein